jgi:hypothetical protein
VWLRILQWMRPSRAAVALLLPSLVTTARAQQETGFLNRRLDLGGGTMLWQWLFQQRR